MKIDTIITSTIKERITSHLFQLARLAALSSATVVAKVNPFICASSGFGVNKLTVTITTTENRNK